MLAAMIEKPNELVVREVPMPTISDSECLVEILACAACNSTDMKLLHGQFRYVGLQSYPGILGHESIGRVIECGSQVTSFKVGDLVLRPVATYAPGEGPNSLWGGFAQYGKITEPLLATGRLASMQQIVPPEIDPIDGTMLITLKETLSWLQRWPVKRDESLVVLGSGPVGVSFGFFAKLLGCNPVIVVGRRDEPLQRALRLGIDAVINNSQEDPVARVLELTGGKGADKVIEAVGDDELLETGLAMTADAGRVGIYGVSPSREPGDMTRRALDIGKGRAEWLVEYFNPQEWAPHEHLLWLVKQGIVNLKDYYTHVVPLEEINRGFDLLSSKEAFKFVVTMK
jgi:L-iditol 2-dehydrogenase